MDLEGMRIDYEPTGPLELDALDPDPVRQIGGWLEQAIAAGVASANAVVLSTVDAAGQPQSRHVLLRGLDERGLTFFTNYESAKGRELEAHPLAALNLAWLQMHRQVRVNGPVARLPAAQSDAYFASRPRASQIGAWASKQSRPIPSREALEAQVAEFERRFTGAVPRPPGWGGYRLDPRMIEFWQGRPNRLHDRLRFTRADGAAPWAAERLSP